VLRVLDFAHVVSTSPAMLPAVDQEQGRMIDLDMMRVGLERGEFFLEYLPTVSLADDRCSGAEALVRWRRAGQVVQPLDFIPTAENTALSGLITYWVFDTVAAEMSDWLRANPDAHIAINVPPEIIGRGGMAYAATKSGLIELAAQIVLEVTERGTPDLQAIGAINSGRRLGIRIALDDVTLQGPANLSILVRADFDIIKLDRSLAAQIDAQCPHPPWLDDVALLTRSKRLVVIAEGVETEQQLAAIRAAGVQAAQGYLFSRPLSAAAFIAFHRFHQAPSVPG
jgi:sensor c-di-GMP phosphodiesterase-like protein